jgi:hypothetical protein
VTVQSLPRSSGAKHGRVAAGAHGAAAKAHGGDALLLGSLSLPPGGGASLSFIGQTATDG